MDPLTLVVTALTVGAASGIGDSASQVIKDAYAALKSRVAARFSADDRAIAILEDHASDPETYDKPLTKFLEKEQVTADPLILELAGRVMKAYDPEGGRVGKYSVEVSDGGQVGNIGDYGTVTMNISGQRNVGQ